MNSLLLSEVFPPRTGGSGRWLWEIYRRLPPEAFQFAVGETPGHEAFDRTHNLSLQRLGLSLPTWGVVQPKGMRGYLRLARQVATLIGMHRIECIHCGKVLPEGFVALLMKYWKGTAYLTFVHGEELNIAENSRELTWMTGVTLRRSTMVVANSKNTAELLATRWKVPADRLCVLNPGVDVDFFVPVQPNEKVRQSLGWQDRSVVLTVGRLQARKGQDQLIRAIESIRREMPNVLYAIVGEGEELESLKVLVRQLRLDKYVQFKTHVDDAELLRCYQQCDLFVLPNRTIDGDFEGFGMVLLEAQACGKAVLAGASGGTRETMDLGNTGRVTDCNDVDRLACEIIDLLQDSAKRRNMEVAARQWTVDRFGWESLSQQANQVFESAFEKRVGLASERGQSVDLGVGRRDLST